MCIGNEHWCTWCLYIEKFKEQDVLLPCDTSDRCYHTCSCHCFASCYIMKNCLYKSSLLVYCCLGPCPHQIGVVDGMLSRNIVCKKVLHDMIMHCLSSVRDYK
jgi:hypothetical protein